MRGIWSVVTWVLFRSGGGDLEWRLRVTRWMIGAGHGAIFAFVLLRWVTHSYGTLDWPTGILAVASVSLALAGRSYRGQASELREELVRDVMES